MTPKLVLCHPISFFSLKSGHLPLHPCSKLYWKGHWQIWKNRQKILFWNKGNSVSPTCSTDKFLPEWQYWCQFFEAKTKVWAINYSSGTNRSTGILKDIQHEANIGLIQLTQNLWAVLMAKRRVCLLKQY